MTCPIGISTEVPRYLLVFLCHFWQLLVKYLKAGYCRFLTNSNTLLSCYLSELRKQDTALFDELCVNTLTNDASKGNTPSLGFLQVMSHNGIPVTPTGLQLGTHFSLQRTSPHFPPTACVLPTYV
jgi:hypothetical protein